MPILLILCVLFLERRLDSCLFHKTDFQIPSLIITSTRYVRRSAVDYIHKHVENTFFPSISLLERKPDQRRTHSRKNQMDVAVYIAYLQCLTRSDFPNEACMSRMPT